MPDASGEETIHEAWARVLEAEGRLYFYADALERARREGGSSVPLADAQRVFDEGRAELLRLRRRY